VVGSVQDAAVPVLAIVASSAALHTFGGVDQAFLTVVAATMIVTLLTALTFLVLGTFRLGNLARFIPYPVIGGFLAGTGWLLMKGGLAVAASTDPQLGTIGQFVDHFELVRWLPAFVFGVVLLIATRVVKRALVIPVVLVIGLVAFPSACSSPGRRSRRRAMGSGCWVRSGRRGSGNPGPTVR
jgi:sulfate permease, SulP family